MNRLQGYQGMQKHEQVAAMVREALKFAEKKQHQEAVKYLQDAIALIGEPNVIVDKKMILGASNVLLLQLYLAGNRAECFYLIEKVSGYPWRSECPFESESFDEMTRTFMSGSPNCN